MDSGPVAANVIDNTDGTYTVTYRPTRPESGASLELIVTVNGTPICGSPFQLVLAAGSASPAHCTASGPGLYDGTAGQCCSVIITARDCYGNALATGGASFAVRITAQRPSCAEFDSWCAELCEMHTPVDRGDGTYLFEWVQPVPAEYALHISLEHTHIKGSPYVCTLVSPFALPPHTIAWRVLEGAGGAHAAQTPSRDAAVAAAAVDGQLVLAGRMAPTVTAGFTRPSLHLCQLSPMYESRDEFLRRDAPLARDFRYRGRVVQPLPVHRMGVPVRPGSAMLGGVATGGFRPGARPTSAPMRQMRPGSAMQPRPFSAMRVAAQRPNSAAPSSTGAVAAPKPAPPAEPLAVVSGSAGTGYAYIVYAISGEAMLEPRELRSRVAAGADDLAVGISRIEIGGGADARLPNLTPLLPASNGAPPAARVGACYAVSATPVSAGAEGPAVGSPEGGPPAEVAAAGEPVGLTLDEMMNSQAFGAKAWGDAEVSNRHSPQAESVWVFGGEGAHGLSDELWRFDGATRRWHRVQCKDGPSARSHAAVAVGPDGCLWMLGGRTADGASEEIWRFDPRKGKDGWTRPQIDGYPPSPRHSHSLTLVLGRYLLACGGVDGAGGPAKEVVFLDMTAMRWHLRSASPAIKAGEAHAAAYVCGRHLLLGDVSVAEPAAPNTEAGAHAATVWPGAPKGGKAVHRVAPLALASGDFTQRSCLVFAGDRYAAARLPAAVGAAIGKGGFSLEAWVMPAEAPSGSTPSIVACKGDSGTRSSFGIVTMAGGQADAPGVQLGVFVGGAAKVQLTARAPLHAWTHVLATFNGAAGSLALYCDGKLVDSGATPISAKDLAGRGETDLFFGGAQGKSGLVGRLDQVALWGRPLTADEAKQTFAEELPQRGRGSGLLGLWTLNEASGDVCIETHLPTGSRKGAARVDATVQGGAVREASTRRHSEPQLIQSDRFLKEKADELTRWRRGFAERHRRQANKADLLMADTDTLNLARLLGEL